MRYLPAGSFKVAVILSKLLLQATASDSGWLYTVSACLLHIQLDDH